MTQGSLYNPINYEGPLKRGNKRLITNTQCSNQTWYKYHMVNNRCRQRRWAQSILAKIIFFLEKIYNKKSCIQRRWISWTMRIKATIPKKVPWKGRWSAIEVPSKCRWSAVEAQTANSYSHGPSPGNSPRSVQDTQPGFHYCLFVQLSSVLFVSWS